MLHFSLHLSTQHKQPVYRQRLAGTAHRVVVAAAAARHPHPRLVTHMQRCSSPQSQIEKEEREERSPFGKVNTSQWCKGERKMPDRRVNNNNTGGKTQTEESHRGCAPLSPLLLSPPPYCVAEDALYAQRGERGGAGMDQ